MVGNLVAGSLALTVHGPAGVIDLMVPALATAGDISAEYAAQCRLAFPPPLHTRAGVPLPADVPLADAGITTGAVLVAPGNVGVPVRSGRGPVRTRERTRSGAVTWFVVAAVVAGLAGWLAAYTSDTRRDLTVGLLAASALIGVLPIGRLAAYRTVVAPVFGAAAAFAYLWSPVPERLPTVLAARRWPPH